MGDINIGNCTLLLNSHDGADDLWDGFFKCLKYNWPEFNMPIVLNTEYKDYSFNGLDIRTYKLDQKHKLTWSKRLKETLKIIDTEYILFFLDDFWINERVDNREFINTFNWFSMNKDIATVCFDPINRGNIDDMQNPLFELRPKKCKYKLNCQCALWRRTILISYLRNHENPWDFELVGSIRAERYKERFYSLKEESKKIISYDFGGVIHRGKWTSNKINDYIIKYDLNIDSEKRGVFDFNQTNNGKKTIIQRLKRPNLLRRIFSRINRYVKRVMSLI